MIFTEIKSLKSTDLDNLNKLTNEYIYKKRIGDLTKTTYETIVTGITIYYIIHLEYTVEIEEKNPLDKYGEA